MKERPILFSGPMVRAILEGRKTQTRRVIKPQPTQFEDPQCAFGAYGQVKDERHLFFWESEYPEEGSIRWGLCPYGQPGDRLWVRETAWISPPDFAESDHHWPLDNEGRRRCIGYDATMSDEGRRCARDYGVRKTPSIHMPRWASRITLEVTGVRVERLQEISEEDARARKVSLARTTSVTPPSGARTTASRGIAARVPRSSLCGTRSTAPAASAGRRTHGSGSSSFGGSHDPPDLLAKGLRPARRRGGRVLPRAGGARMSLDRGCDRCDEQIGCTSNGLQWLCGECTERQDRAEEWADDWETCDTCGGDCYFGHDCGEDSCCCLRAEENVPCATCNGKGGWARPP